MRFRLLFLVPVLFISACTPVVDPDEVNLDIDMNGSVVLSGVPFELDINVVFDDPEKTVPYVLEIVTEPSASGNQVLASISLAGNHRGSVEIVLHDSGETLLWSQLRNVDREGIPLEGDSVSLSQALEVIAIDPGDASVDFSNPPEIWLVDEPFTSAIGLSDALESLPVEIILEKRNSRVEEDFNPFFVVQAGAAPKSFNAEEFVEMRVSVQSGPRVIAVSEPHAFEVLNPQGMIQKFFYEQGQVRQDGDPQKLFEWTRDTAFPGFFNPTPEQIDQLLVEFEDGFSSPSGAVYFETIRDNTPNFDPGLPDWVQCFSRPEEWPPVPGRHFMFDYDRRYTLWIGDTKIGEGSDRGTRHLTFYDGKAYKWSYVC